MSRSKIAALIIAAVMVVSGISMLILGLTVGAAPVVSIGNKDTVKKGGSTMESGNIDLDDFDSVRIDVSSVDTIIEKGDGYSLEYMAYNDSVPETEVKNGHLTITQPGRNAFFMFDFRFFGNDQRPYYKLTVPDDCKKLDINLESSSGDFASEGINISGKLELSSGDVRISDSEGKELELKASSGSIDLEKVVLKKLKVRVSSGGVSIYDSRIDDITTDLSSGSTKLDDVEVKNADLESSSGDITLNLLGKEDDYSFDIDTSSGDIKIGDKKLDDHYETDGNKSGSIKADVSSGDVTIDFK